MEKAYLHYLVRWRFTGTDTTLLTHHVAACRDGKQLQHGQLVKENYMRLYDSGITSLVSIDCKEVTEGEYTLLKHKYMEVI
ncbi:hypothetical protein [Bacillus thuringiensis]|uniref:hypothetical protein n=1 Tax=Bacillus thuringiensis TaxID=1428 RepID=UPI00159C508E|nr:hypothetical protein [Bacillus thuringiensis]